jgi:SMC interacting uncharacterized protein involved in chromosome segregation
MSVLSFLFDRKKSCAECAMHVREIDCLRDDLIDTKVRLSERAERIDELEPLAAERDGLVRELWMERRRIDELSAQLDNAVRSFQLQYGMLERGAHRVLTELALSREALRQSEEARKEVIGG